MANDHRAIDLTETTLLIKCARCGSALAVRPQTSHQVDWENGKCFACGEPISEPGITGNAVSLYRQLCELVLTRSVRIRLDVPSA